MTEVLAKLSEVETEAFKQTLKERDQYAFKAGVATLEANKIVAKMQAMIDNSIRQEAQLINQIALNHGIDIEHTRFSIDYETGEIIKL
jgi:hypothetical protein